MALFALANPTRTAIAGDIAGYGYSPILEAYANFGTIGVAPAFFLFGLCLAVLERARARTGGFPVILLYLMVLPIAQQFHRSTFGNAVLSPGLWIVITILFASAIYRLAAWRVAPKPAGRK